MKKITELIDLLPDSRPIESLCQFHWLSPVELDEELSSWGFKSWREICEINKKIAEEEELEFCTNDLLVWEEENFDF
jgi:hypothetical protein